MVKSSGLVGRITSWMEGWEGWAQVGVRGAIFDGLLLGVVVGFGNVLYCS